MNIDTNEIETQKKALDNLLAYGTFSNIVKSLSNISNIMESEDNNLSKELVRTFNIVNEIGTKTKRAGENLRNVMDRYVKDSRTNDENLASGVSTSAENLGTTSTNIDFN